MRRPHRMLAVLPASLLLVGVLAGCSDEADTTTDGDSPGVETTTSADCAALVPASALDDLGWTASGAPALEAGRCTQQTDGGQVAVQRRPVPGTSSDDLPKAGQQQYDEQCAGLGDGTDGSDAAGAPVDWLGSDVQGCALTTEDGAGVNTLLALTPPGLLVEVAVLPDAATDPEAVQAALTDLAQTAISELGGA